MFLKDRVAVITGAASKRGLGKETARLFSEHGARVAILDLDPEGCRETASELGSGHLGFKCDVTSREQCKVAADRVLESEVMRMEEMTLQHHMTLAVDAIADQWMSQVSHVDPYLMRASSL